jgi:hypothetical protein
MAIRKQLPSGLEAEAATRFRHQRDPFSAGPHTGIFRLVQRPRRDTTPIRFVRPLRPAIDPSIGWRSVWRPSQLAALLVAPPMS